MRDEVKERNDKVEQQDSGKMVQRSSGKVVPKDGVVKFYFTRCSDEWYKKM